MIEKINSLINELNKASEYYYNTDTPIMSDAEFDEKLKELERLEKLCNYIRSDSPTVSVGSNVISQLNKVTIYPIPMLSLNKVFTTQEIKDFANGKKVVAMSKCDGLSVRLIYRDGKLYSANTRGNGYEGTDITKHIVHFINVPLKINYLGEYIIDGEAIIKKHHFEQINQNGQFKNPRNTAAGTLNTLDANLCRQRKLSFIAWDVLTKESLKEDSLDVRLQCARNLGFEIVNYVITTTNNQSNYDEINKIIIENSEKLNIPIDGVVWKLDSFTIGEQFGSTSHHFNNAVAWKPEVEKYSTHLRNIEWSMGRTGVLTPVAIFDPIETENAIIERANLHNLNVLVELLGNYPHTGQSIEVYQANLIIPQIFNADKTEYTEDYYKNHQVLSIPDVCPICGEETCIIETTGSRILKCNNPKCEGKLINQLDHFCGKKGLDIKGLSTATLEKLVNACFINDIKDLFNLEGHADEWKTFSGFGEKSVNKILESIQSSRTTTLDRFICALGIPNVGATVSKQLSSIFNSYEAFRDAIKNDYKFYKLPGFGIEIHNAIMNFNYEQFDYIYFNYITIPKIIKEENIHNKTLNGMIIVITGKLIHFKNRNELQEIIEAHGGKIVNSISKNSSLLINNDIKSNSAKNINARKLGIPIIDEETFIKQYLQN